MILALYDYRYGADIPGGNVVVYDLERETATFGEGKAEGPSLVWELSAWAAEDAKLAVPVEVEPGWLMRCDRVDFPPGGIAYRHTHPGPGIRCLLHGAIRIESGGEAHEYGPLDAWFESGPEPVLALTSDLEPSSFVRVLLLPPEWAGKRTIRYVDPEDEQRPKLQRATVYLEEPVAF
jgi:quercetin dioxygenase-like cupin family protein